VRFVKSVNIFWRLAYVRETLVTVTGHFSLGKHAPLPQQVVCSGLRRLVSTRSMHCAAFVLGLVAAGDPLAAENVAAPAKNWVLPLFTKEGFRSMTARGSEARVSGPHQFEVVDLNLTPFSSDAATRVETILLSPAATFLPDAKIAQGEKTVRFIGEEVEATGVRWVYHHVEKKISLDGDVRVTFSAELKNILQ